MARYIDADKFKSHLEKAMEKMHIIAGVKAVDVGAVIKALDMQPTADVVPKSECEKLVQVGTRLGQENETLKDNNEHLAVMLEETKIELDAMRGAANSLKMHYEKAEAEVDRLKYNLKAVLEEIPETKREFAGEIFAEIDNILYKFSYPSLTAIGNINVMQAEGYHLRTRDYAELKKKYTEVEERN